MADTHYFFELNTYDAKELENAKLFSLAPGNDDANWIVSRLLSFRDGDSALLKRASGKFFFDFVGLIYFGGHLFYVLPKYLRSLTLDESKRQGYMQLVLDVINRYNKRQRTLNESGYNVHESSGRSSLGQLALWKMIVDDYLEHGFYDETEYEYIVNGPGDIDWDKTLTSIQPIISDGRAFYFDTITREKRRVFSNPIKEIQEAVLNEIMTKLADYNLMKVLKVPLIEISSSRLPFRNIEKSIALLQRERNKSFSTRKRVLLTALIDYLEQDLPNSPQTQILYFGTTHFNLVWEDVCREVFSGKQTGKYIRLIDRVQWGYLDDAVFERRNAEGMNTLDEDADVQEQVANEKQDDLSDDKKGRLHPDSLSVYNDYFYILDAKYYTPSYGRTGISGQPALGDVTKQYLYQAALYKHYTAGHRVPPKVINAFVVPSDDLHGKLVRKRGFARLPFMEDLIIMGVERLASPIHLIELSAAAALQTYLNRGFKSSDYFNALNSAIEDWADC